MDELVIGDKKYISSKRAAKETGYAKDYIGQLCREGRVPARLVGRSWYVLESAIHDHRFGEQKQEENADIIISTTWESPRYEASTPETLPFVDVTKEEFTKKEEDSLGFANVSEHLEDAWKAWFERKSESEKEGVSSSHSHSHSHSQERASLKEEVIEEKGEVVPIRAVYTEPPRELLPRSVRAEEVLLEEYVPVRTNRSFLWVRIFGGLTAMAMLILAALGTGYFDTYIASHKQVGAAAGILLYKR
jgi:hypothetical protein